MKSNLASFISTLAFIIFMLGTASGIVLGIGLIFSPQVREIVISHLLAISIIGQHISATSGDAVIGKVGIVLASLGIVWSLAFGLEIIGLGWKRSSLRRLFFRRSISSWYDAGFYLLILTRVIVVIALVSTIGLSYVSGLFANWLVQTVTSYKLQIATSSHALNFMLYFIAWSFFDYWNHRLMHTGPFWYLHRMHHSATELNLITSARNHPAILAIEPFIRTWAAALFLAPPEYLLVFGAINSFYQLLVHSMVPWNFGWFGRWILISPIGYRIHHSPMPEHADKNLSVLIIWDRLFGTWYEGSVVNDAVGIPERVHNSGNIFLELLIDLKTFLREIKKVVFNRNVKPTAPSP